MAKMVRVILLVQRGIVGTSTFLKKKTFKIVLKAGVFGCFSHLEFIIYWIILGNNTGVITGQTED